MDLLAALRAFCAVASEGSFTRGAAASGQLQPVASRRIAALEERFGTTLFIRTSRRVDLSRDGERLLPLAQEVLTRTDRIERLFADTVPELVIAVPEQLTAQSRAAIRRGLADYRAAFAADDPHHRASALHAGSAHLALLPVAPDEGEILVELGVAHHPHHSMNRFHLDQLRRPVRERDLPVRRLHLLDEDTVPATRDPVRSVFFAAGLRADQLVHGTPDVEAWTSAHELDDVVLSSRRQAAQHDLRWTPLRDPAVFRSYRLAGDAEISADERRLLVDRLASGLDGVATADRVPR